MVFRVRPPRDSLTLRELCDAWERNVDPSDEADVVGGKLQAFLSK
jgi:hypothetical protein